MFAELCRQEFAHQTALDFPARRTGQAAHGYDDAGHLVPGQSGSEVAVEGCPVECRVTDEDGGDELSPHRFGDADDRRLQHPRGTECRGFDLRGVYVLTAAHDEVVAA